ncbi:ATP-binding protein [Nocardiopsis sp. EMB25]|uniref:ATP-binding protein n=1 Tax=Nocardiopsis sp. EMB25 TaxID=2835867 RepID=UPI0022841DF1|nr:ATP-binding protein [Nocardiopsis sp. EMB25]MCY9784953.1 ATP-binding protein [Nocardiopsis sp. EMB25]
MAKNMSTAGGCPSALIRFPTAEQCVCHLELVDGCLPARLARKATRLIVGSFGSHAEQVPQIEEAVGELVANAERYAPKPWRLRLYLDDRALWVGVGDGDPRTALPVEERLRCPAIPRWSEKHGRGLFLARTACRGECWVRSTSTGASVTGGKEILLRFARDSVSAPAV